MSPRKRAAASTDPHDHLGRVAPELTAIMERAGRCPLTDRAAVAPTGDQAFVALVRAIVSQQLSGKAADTIFGRVEALGGGALPGPAELAAMPDDKLRAAGLSGAKTRGVKDLAARVLTGELALDTLHAQDDEAVITSLVRVKGIGRWTAEMFLMFRLGRLDILSTADLGLRKGLMILHGLAELPDPATMEKLVAHWRPFRSIGSWYLWRVAEGAPPLRKAAEAAQKSVAKAGANVAKKGIAAKRAAAKKGVAGKGAAGKNAVAKKVVVKKSVVKKPVVKKAVAKKAVAKRPVAKKR